MYQEYEEYPNGYMHEQGTVGKKRIYHPPHIPSYMLEDKSPIQADFLEDYETFLKIVSDLLSIHKMYSHESYISEPVTRSSNMQHDVLKILPGRSLKSFCHALSFHCNELLKNNNPVDRHAIHIQKCELALGEYLRTLVKLQEEGDIGCGQTGGWKQGELIYNSHSEKNQSIANHCRNDDRVYTMLTPKRDGLSENKNLVNTICERSQKNLDRSAQLRKNFVLHRQQMSSQIENQTPTTIDDLCDQKNDDEEEEEEEDIEKVYSIRSKNVNKQKVHNSARVMAPEKLPGGFAFEARIGDKVFMAIVPSGGVEKGEIFESPVINVKPELEKDVRTEITVDMQIPKMRWRDGLFNCFSYGVLHPTLLNSIFCPLVALIQVRSRLPIQDASIFLTKPIGPRSIALIVTMMIMMHFVFAFYLWRAFLHNSHVMFLAYGCVPIILLADFVGLYFFLFLLIKTRAKIRKMYYIPGKCVTEDFLVSIFCTSCVLSQMGRHTADYETYNSRFCSDTGLPPQIKVRADDCVRK